MERWSLPGLTGELRSALVGECPQESPESGGVLAIVLVYPVKKQVLLPPQHLGAEQAVEAGVGPEERGGVLRATPAPLGTLALCQDLLSVLMRGQQSSHFGKCWEVLHRGAGHHLLPSVRVQLPVGSARPAAW